PALAAASAARKVPAAMISASHNPFADNGIKLFAAGGAKLSDERQGELEALIDSLRAHGPGDVPTGAGVGTTTGEPSTVLADYADGVVAALDGRELAGLRVALDCAHGSNSTVARTVFERLGATVDVICAEPDGVNIN